MTPRQRTRPLSLLPLSSRRRRPKRPQVEKVHFYFCHHFSLEGNHRVAKVLALSIFHLVIQVMIIYK